MPEFDGTGDPLDYIAKFRAKAELYQVSDAIYCKIFRTTFSKKALNWFDNDSLKTIHKKFLSQFSINRKYPKPPNHLFKYVQKDNESLREFMQRFMSAVQEIPDLSHDLPLSIIQQNLRPGKFKDSLAGRPPRKLQELLDRAEKYIRMEETPGTSTFVKRKRDEDRRESGRRDDSRDNRRREERKAEGPRGYTNFTPLKARLGEVLEIAEEKGLVTPPRLMKENPNRQKSKKYCRFHKDRGHFTEDCHQLKIAIKKLIRQGHLSEFIDKHPDKKRGDSRDDRPKDHYNRGRNDKGKEPVIDNLPTLGEVGILHGGPSNGDTPSARRALVRASRGSHVCIARLLVEIFNTNLGREEVTFSNLDLQGPMEDHNDALVISASIANYWVRRILIDTGASADIIYLEPFRQMDIGRAKITLVNTPIIAFGGQKLYPHGEVELPISLGTHPRRVTKVVKFLIIDAPCEYMCILGRPSLNAFQAVASTYHMKLKFPTLYGVGKTHGDQLMARECYANSLRHLQNLHLPERKDRADDVPGDGGDNIFRNLKRKWVYD